MHFRPLTYLVVIVLAQHGTVGAVMPTPVDLSYLADAIVLFRFFDIAKPPPIRQLERRYGGGFGVMFDDIVAAAYTLLALAVMKRAFF